MKIKFYHKLLLLTWLLCLWAGCSDDHFLKKGEEVPEGMERVRIDLSGLGLEKQTVQTRGMENGTGTESTISNVYIHIYKPDGTEIPGLANPYSVQGYTYGPTLTGDAEDASGYVSLYLPNGTMATDYTVLVSADHDIDLVPELNGSAYPAPPFYMSGICSSFDYDASYYTYSANVWLSRGVAKVRASFSVSDDVVPAGTTIDLPNVTMQLLNVPARIRPFAPYDSYKNPPVAAYPSYVNTMQAGWSDATPRYDLPQKKVNEYTAGEIDFKNGKNYYPMYAYENFVTDTYTGSVKLKVSIPLYRLVNGTKIYLKTQERTVSLKRDNDSTLLRNYIYPVDFIVKSGETVEVYTDMLEWKEENFYDILGTYLTASNVEMNQTGSIPCNFKTDGDTLFVDWSDIPAEVKRSGIATATPNVTYFTGLVAESGSIPLQWNTTDGNVAKSYMGFIRNLTLRVGNITRQVEISYIPTLVVDCHVIDMPMYAYVEGGSSGNNRNYYGVEKANTVLATATIADSDQCPWLHLSPHKRYNAAEMTTSLSNSAVYIHCDENSYTSTDRYAVIQYTLPGDLDVNGEAHRYELRIKQVIPVFVGYWGKYNTQSGYYTEALYTEQIEELEQGYVPYTLTYAPVRYTDPWEGYGQTFAGYQPAAYDNYRSADYCVLNYCASKNRADANGNIATTDRNWFAPSEYQLAGMIGLADRYDSKLQQSINAMPVWHYASTDCNRGSGGGALGVHFGSNRIGLINYGQWDDNAVRCVRTCNVSGKIEVKIPSYPVVDLQNLPGNYYSSTTLSLQKGATLGDTYSAANTAYKKLRIARYYARSSETPNIGYSTTSVRMTWAAAVGLPASFNNASATTATTANMVATGCNAYWEDDISEKGTWRLPTAREAAIIATLKGHLNIYLGSEEYWTQTEFYQTSYNRYDGTYIRYNDNIPLYMHNANQANKTYYRSARCVREEP